MLSSIKITIKKFLDVYPKWLCRREYLKQEFFRFNERPVEFGFVFEKLRKIYPRSILDVGSGTTSLPHLMRNCGFLVSATDNVRDYWPSGMANRHYHVIDDDITDTKLTGSYDVITCISVLEHIQVPEKAVRNMFSLLKINGHMILTFPYSEKHYCRNVYELPNSSYGRESPFITQSFSRDELSRWLDDNRGTVVDQQYWQFWSGDQWTQGEQVIPPRQVSVEEKHQLTCVLIRNGSSDSEEGGESVEPIFVEGVGR
jgi:SAM-dependent methyltransferase